MQDRFNEMLVKSSNLLQTDPEIHDLLEAEDISACNQSDYIYHNAGYPIHGNTTAEYFQVGVPGSCKGTGAGTALYFY